MLGKITGYGKSCSKVTDFCLAIGKLTDGNPHLIVEDVLPGVAIHEVPFTDCYVHGVRIEPLLYVADAGAYFKLYVRVRAHKRLRNARQPVYEQAGVRGDAYYAARAALYQREPLIQACLVLHQLFEQRIELLGVRREGNTAVVALQELQPQLVLK